MADYPSPGARCKAKKWDFETYSRMGPKNFTRKSKCSEPPGEWACMACLISFTVVFSLLFPASGILVLKGAEEKEAGCWDRDRSSCVPTGALSVLPILWLFRWCGCFPGNLGWFFNFAPGTYFNHSSLNMLSLRGPVLGLSEGTSKFSACFPDVSILFNGLPFMLAAELGKKSYNAAMPMTPYICATRTYGTIHQLGQKKLLIIGCWWLGSAY